MSRMHEESLANEKPLDTKYVRVLICGTINSDGSLQEHYSCSDSNKEPEKEEVLAKDVAQFVDTFFNNDTHCEDIHLKLAITYLSEKAPYPLYEEGRNLRLWVWDFNVQRNEPISVQEILPDSSVIV